MASTSFDLRYWVAIMMAVSLASVPDAVKNTRASGIPETAATSSANRIMGSDKYKVDVCMALAAWSCTALTTSGLLWPIIVVKTPPNQSRYLSPSTPYT